MLYFIINSGPSLARFMSAFFNLGFFIFSKIVSKIKISLSVLHFYHLLNIFL